MTWNNPFAKASNSAPEVKVAAEVKAAKKRKATSKAVATALADNPQGRKSKRDEKVIKAAKMGQTMGKAIKSARTK